MAKKPTRKPTTKKGKAEAAILSSAEIAAKLEEEKQARAEFNSLSKSDRLAIIRKRASEFGASIEVVSSVELPYHIKRPFGIPSLDIGCAGGPGAGTLTVIWGKPGSGKNFIVNMAMRRLQQTYGDDTAILFGSFGYQFDKPWACRHGLAVPLTEAEIAAIRYSKGVLSPEEEAMYRRSVGAFDLIRPNLLQEGVAESPAETMLQGCVEAIKSGEYQMVVIDEGNIPSTREDLARTMSNEPKTAGLARLFTQFMGRMLNALSYPGPDGGPNKTSVVMILESRDLIGGTMPGMSRQSGGEAKNHIKVIDLNLSSGEPITRGSMTVGKQIKWRVTKAKMGTSEGAHGVYDFFFATEKEPGGVDVVKDLATLLVQYRVLGVAGTWYSDPQGERIGQGIDAVKRWLLEVPGRYDQMYDQVMTKAGFRATTQ